MKIIYAVNFYQQLGGENMWFSSEPDLLREHGHEVVIYSRDNKEIDSFSLFQKAALFWQTAFSRRTYREFSALIRREKPDIVHVHNVFPLISPSIYYACRDAAVPAVQSIHNYRLVCPAATLLRDGRICEECIDHSLWRNVRYKCYRGSRLQSAALSLSLHLNRKWDTWRTCVEAFIVPSEFMKSKLVHAGIDLDQIVLKPHWHRPDPGPRKDWEHFALYLGRLSVEKGVGTLLEAWNSADDLPLLKIAGDGPMREELETMLKRGTRSPVEYLGWKNRDELAELFGKAYCLVLPSNWYEAFPHVMVEAFALGVPVVASRIGTLADVVRHGENGFLFDVSDPVDLAKTIRRIFADENAAKAAGAGARRLFETKLTADQTCRNLLRIYGDAIARRRARTSAPGAGLREPKSHST